MQLSNIQRSTIAKSILVDKPSIIMFMPSTQFKIWDGIYTTGLLLNNARGMVVPNRIEKINKKTFNGKLHYLEMRKRMMELKGVTKKIQVVSTINFDTDESKIKEKSAGTFGNVKQKFFYFYDLTTLQDALSFFLTKLPERKVYSIFISEIQKIYTKLKENSPGKEVRMIFDIRSKEDFFYTFLVEILRISALMKKELSDSKFFDGFAFASVGKVLIPVLEYDEDQQFSPILPMIKRLESYVEAEETARLVDGTPAISDKEFVGDEELKEIPNKSLASKIVDALSNPGEVFAPTVKKNLISDGQVMPDKKLAAPTKPVTINAKTDDSGDVKIELDGRALSKVMKFYKISNPDIIANTKAAIDDYIKSTGTVPTKSNAELLVLKAVSRSVHGTDEINDEYLTNPNLLFDKLKDINVFSVPLEFPKGDKSFPFEFKDVVTLPAVTGQHRQKFEFAESIHENIEKVFKTLESHPTHPIKVNDISYEYVDTDSERFTEYTISLQNMTGNKLAYQVKLNVPAPINDKYFKIGGNRYIFSSQQHLKVITKTSKNDVRILTNYAIIRLSLENLRYNISDISDVAHYIQQRYPNLILSADDKKVEFGDGDIVYTVGNQVYTGINDKVVISEENGKLVNLKSPDTPLKSSRFEYIFDVFLNKIQAVNPTDSLTKSKKSIPYVAIYMSGIKMPFIIYMWFQKGLLSTLNQFGINYVITEDRGEKGSVFVELEDGKFLVLQPTSIKERLIVNGLLMSKIKYPIADLDSPEEIRRHIIETYGEIIFLRRV